MRKNHEKQLVQLELYSKFAAAISEIERGAKGFSRTKNLEN